jgi:membrane protease YdiL (CAAX protease family)
MTQGTLGLIIYVVLAFGLAWTSWYGVYRRRVPVDDYRFQLAILPGSFAPAIAATIVRAFITHEGFGTASFIPTIARTWPTYLIGWLLPLAIAVASYSVIRASRRLRAFASEVKPIGQHLRFLAALPLVAVVAVPLAFGEEFGWRVYLQSHLFPGSPLLAALVTGLIWALWHLPLILMGYGYPTERGKGFAAFTVWTVLFSIFLGWIYARTGDVWAVSLAHMASDAIGTSIIGSLVPGDRKRHVISYEGWIAAVPLAVVCLVLALTGAFST